MFEKYVLPIIMSVSLIAALVGFFFTDDLRFGFLATWGVMWFYLETAPKTVNILIERPKDDNKQQEEKTDEGDSHRD